MTNNQTLSPLYLSILNDKDDCSEYLLENGAKPFLSAS